MIFINLVKLGCAVIFIKDIASLVSLIFLPKWNSVSCMKFIESFRACEKWPKENFVRKYWTIIVFLYPIYWCWMQRFWKQINRKQDNFTKILISIFFLATMSHQPANFVSEKSWLMNLWKDLKVESTLKI